MSTTVTVSDSTGTVTVTESGSTVAVAGGTSGNAILKGSGSPSTSQGVNGNLYIDYTNHKWYGPKSDSGWGTAWGTVPEGMTEEDTW